MIQIEGLLNDMQTSGSLISLVWDGTAWVCLWQSDGVRYEGKHIKPQEAVWECVKAALASKGVAALWKGVKNG